MMKTWNFVLLASAISGCGKEPPAKTESAPVAYDYVFETPPFMESKPQGQDIAHLRWIWYSESRMLNLTHMINKQPATLFGSPGALKTAVENDTRLTMPSEFAQVTPERLFYQHQDDKSWVFAFAEKTPDDQVTVAIFGIFPTVPRELRAKKNVELILEALKTGHFKERSADWPPR